MNGLIPPGADERQVDTACGRLRVLHGGTPHPDRVPALLLHGGGSDHSGISWYRLIEPLARDREVWAIDVPGFGGSIAVPPVGGPREIAATVADAMTGLGLDRVIVFGVSMGGDVALNLALDHPDRVAGLVLIAPGGLVPVIGNRVVQRLAWLASRAPDWLLLPAGRFANRFAGTAIRSLVKDPATLPDEVFDEFSRMSRDPRSVLGYARYNQATLGRDRMTNDLSDRVRDLHAPTLFFHGQDDPIVDPDGSRRAAGRMPDARLVSVPDCGHWAQLEAHDQFLAEALAFLAELDR